MNMTTSSSSRSKTLDFLFCALAIILLLLSPVLGVIAAAIATWHALLAGSFWYMPLGLVLFLAMIAIVQRHKSFDFALFGLLLLGVIIWFTTNALKQGRLLDTLQALGAQTGLMGGLLIILSLSLVSLNTTRLYSKRITPSHRIWVTFLAIGLLLNSASGDSMARLL